MTHSNSTVASAFRARVRITVCVALALLLTTMSLTSNTAQAQTSTALIHHTVVKLKNQPPSLGRDFWFSFMMNYWGVDDGGAYLAIYITSPVNTTAYIQYQSQLIPVPISAMQVGIYYANLSWEMTSSGEQESKSVHVWSNDADLTVYEMNRNSATTDGSYCIPTIGWGTDYVVAAYGSLFEGFGNTVYDDPSTMAVTADEDNTTVTITPTCDCRQCWTGSETGGGPSATTIVFPSGQPITVTLNRGEDFQLIPVLASSPDGFDLTGTIVHANQPVGLEGGCNCPNIPDDFPYCDHVEEQMPPVRAWAETYYSTAFEQAPGTPADHDFACYLFIASQNGQTINGHNCLKGDFTECIIDNQYGYYFDFLEGAQKFSSDAPFLEYEYICSATYPDGVNGLGDPAEAVVNPREQYSKTVVFETPVYTGGKYPDPYYNYANITVNIKDANKTLFDGQRISNHPSQCIDGNWEVIPITDISAGAHLITGDDSGVGVYIYGYGYDESYAWTGGFGTATFHSPDTVPPDADTSGACYQASVWVSDSGLLPDGVNMQSGLGEIVLDSDYNMTYVSDVNFVPGAGEPGSGYRMYVNDVTKPAILIIDAYDVAGNETIITSTYKPTVDSIKPPLQNLGAWLPGYPANIAYDTLYNDGTTTLNIQQLQLKYGNVGFSLHDSAGGALDMSPLGPGQHRLIQIQFTDPNSQKQVDSIIFGAPCDPQAVAVIGSGGQNDFDVTNQAWPNELLGQSYTKTVIVNNLSAKAITIDSANLEDSHFTFVPGQFPFVLQVKPGTTINVIYTPDAGSLTAPNITHGNWYSHDVLEADGVTPSVRNDSLSGNAIAPSTTFGNDTTITITCSSDSTIQTVALTLTSTGTSPSTISRVFQTDTNDFLPLEGMLSNGTPWNPDSVAQQLPAGQSASIIVRYKIPYMTNSTVVNYIYAVDAQGDTIGSAPVTVTMNVEYWAYALSQPSVTFGPVPYQGPSTTQTFTISNTAQSVLAITNVNLTPVGKYNGAFTVTTVPFCSTVDTALLQPGQTMTVTVVFNDSFSFDPQQTALIDIQTNSCTSQSMTIDGFVQHPNPYTRSYTPTPVLSCETPSYSVAILNPEGKDSVFDGNDTIIAVKWIGANAGTYFQMTPPASGTIIPGSTDTIPAGITTIAVPDTFYIPVTFMPNSQQTVGAGLVTYTDSLQVELHTSDGTDTILIIPVSGMAGSVQFATNSTIANTTTNTNTGVAGNSMTLPAAVTSNIPNGLGVTVDQLGITSVTLTYIIPNRDMLTAGTFVPSIPGWSVALQTETAKGQGLGADTIVITLSGPAMPANTSNFGNLPFTVDLDQSVDVTPVTLESVQLFTGANGTTPVGPCITSIVSSGNFILNLACGDSTLRDVMNGGQNINFAGPATPDPVTGGNVTFKYANRGASTLTLAIYDELGNEVARPVDNVYQSAGEWQVSCDVSKLPSGTYTYRLSGNAFKTGPMAVSSQFVIER